MSIYAFQENAPTAAALDGTEILPINQSGVVKQITSQALKVLAPVNTTATTLTVTQAAHGGRTVTISSAAPIAVTLPQATGSGAKYKFQIQVAATATGHTIKVANGTDVMQGIMWQLTSSSNNAIGFATSATSDTITLDGTTRGGVVGDVIEIEDVKTGFFSVLANVVATGTYATPFSATVS